MDWNENERPHGATGGGRTVEVIRLALILARPPDKPSLTLLPMIPAVPVPPAQQVVTSAVSHCNSSGPAKMPNSHGPMYSDMSDCHLSLNWLDVDRWRGRLAAEYLDQLSDRRAKRQCWHSVQLYVDLSLRSYKSRVCIIGEKANKRCNLSLTTSIRLRVNWHIMITRWMPVRCNGTV
jgi:hypothetical protein